MSSAPVRTLAHPSRCGSDPGKTHDCFAAEFAFAESFSRRADIDVDPPLCRRQTLSIHEPYFGRLHGLMMMAELALLFMPTLYGLLARIWGSTSKSHLWVWSGRSHRIHRLLRTQTGTMLASRGTPEPVRRLASHVRFPKRTRATPSPPLNLVLASVRGQGCVCDSSDGVHDCR